ncbi:UDP-2,3-diacylglucosamine diphosphatase [Parasulfuritortus cantonensis]|uniref:UDP-2,3-diacylglucosamine hydrolase n=1 Tax=Parasulfuritortus cantonensis TaxID=2528202 RepID=A0A4R1BMK4_9PROT|nr:UDP-2,3-diacylglucosamine diphosphatase [Parasulfuritortus cantonensis]TCJ18548.1 UDP-2,3-diacylglucosamine diphosphatase [Parasulfuritortus cantonensis]
MKADPRPSLFISDLHLAPDQPATQARFFAWLAGVAPGARAVYILGDLFEAWPGDDFLADPFAAAVAAALAKLGQAGVPVYLLHGNRDFMLGAAFCAATGARLLAEPEVVAVAGGNALLLHGDSLCTDDDVYQGFRRLVRDPAWQQAMLAKPLAERVAIARQMRERSESDKDGKNETIMDVNAEAVAEAFRRAGCSVMIHGHTHRPARHDLVVDGAACVRWVLPDWYDGRGGYLRCDAAGCALIDY